MAGVKGDIEFRETSIDRTRAIISIATNESYQWEIREFPVLTTDVKSCDEASLGRV